MGLDQRLRDGDRAADARARLYAGEIRARIETFKNEHYLGLGRSTALFVEDLELICARMEAPSKSGDHARPLTLAEWDNLIEFPPRRPAS